MRDSRPKQGMWMALAVLLLPVSACGTGDKSETPPDPSLFSYSTHTMGTVATVQLAGTDSLALADLAYHALVEFHRADSLLSNWTEDSELARVNREAAKGWVEIGADLGSILELADTVHRESGGAFDPTIEPLVRAWGFLEGTPRVPSRAEIDAAMATMGWTYLQLDAEQQRVHFDHPQLQLDLGGIAKGHAVDFVARILDAEGVSNYMVDLSGNMVVRGSPPGRATWRIGVRDPHDRLPHLGLLELRDTCLASSGDYEQFVELSGKRYGHILDPRTGYPVEGMAGVTVIAPSASAADAWATALFVMGLESARDLAAARSDLSCILIERAEDGTLKLWIEESLRGSYLPHPDLDERVALHWF